MKATRIRLAYITAATDRGGAADGGDHVSQRLSEISRQLTELAEEKRGLLVRKETPEILARIATNDAEGIRLLKEQDQLTGRAGDGGNRFRLEQFHRGLPVILGSP